MVLGSRGNPAFDRLPQEGYRGFEACLSYSTTRNQTAQKQKSRQLSHLSEFALELGGTV